MSPYLLTRQLFSCGMLGSINDMVLRSEQEDMSPEVHLVTIRKMWLGTGMSFTLEWLKQKSKYMVWFCTICLCMD